LWLYVSVSGLSVVGGYFDHTATALGEFRDGLIHLAVVTVDATGYTELWVDGVLGDTDDTGGGASTSGKSYIGCYGSASLYPTNGVIYSAGTIGRVMSGAEIVAQWNRARQAASYYQDSDIQTGTYTGPCIIPGTPWHLTSGDTVTVANELIGSEIAVTATASSTAIMTLYPDGELAGCLGSPAESRYGTFRFQTYNDGADLLRIYLGNWASNNTWLQFSGSTGVVTNYNYMFQNVAYSAGSWPAGWSTCELVIAKTATGYTVRTKIDDADLTGAANPASVAGAMTGTDLLQVNLADGHKLRLDGFLKRPTWEV
jgi:hypothetical protein